MIERAPPQSDGHPVPASLAVQSVVRPKRVAFLYDQAKVTLAEIDTAILAATECWGGAYWPLVPVAGDHIEPNWWSLLDAVDPDVVCALHDLAPTLRHQVARKCAPLRLLQSPNNPEQRQPYGRVSRHQIGALSTAALPSVIYSEQRFLPMYFRFLALEDKGGEASNRTFALRNFGALTKDARFSRSFDDLAHQWLDVAEKTPVQLLGDFAMGGPVTPRDMARFKAEPPFLSEWSTESCSFWLVVGDSPMDVALAWNSAISQDSNLGRSCLWLSKADAGNPDLLAEVGKWIGRGFYANRGSGEGLVLSYSEPLTTLEAVASGVKGSTRFTCRVLSKEQSLFGKFRRVRPSAEVLRVQQVAMRDDSGLVEFARPAFAPRNQYDGGWMVDLEIEHPRDPSIISSSLPVWKVPRRPGVASCFGGAQQAVRVSWNHTPSFEVSGGDSDVRFCVPAARSVFERCLAPTVLAANGDLSVKLPHPFSMETSNAGLQLRGVLGLFGGLFQAGNTFENPFWRDLLTELAGRPEDARARQVKAVSDVLIEAARKSGGQIAEAEVGSLAVRVAEKAWRTEPSTRRIDLAKLSSRFGSFTAQWTKNNPKQSSFRRGEKFDDYLANDLANLIERGVLLQGVTLRCPGCFTEYWLHVDDLRRTSPCPGCLASVQVPPGPSWSVQANELVSSAIRQGGALPVIHALYELQRGSLTKTFTFIASQDVLTYPDGEQVTDLDLMVLLDGELVIGEVKSHARGFDAASVKAMVHVAEVMLPDLVLFVAEGGGTDWPIDVSDRLDEAIERLRAIGVDARRDLLQWL